MSNEGKELSIARVNHDCVTPTHPSGLTTWRLNGPDGLEIALLPPLMIEHQIRAKKLVRVLTQYQYSAMGLLVAYPSRRHLPLAVSALIDFVGEKIMAIEKLNS